MFRLLSLGLTAMAALGCDRATVGDEGDDSGGPSGTRVVVRGPSSLWIAAKVEGGSWSRLTASGTDRFEIDTGSSGRYSLAFGLPGEELQLIHATRDELAEVLIGTASNAERFLLSGRIVGHDPTSSIWISGRETSFSVAANGATTLDFELEVPGGKLDLIAQEYSGLELRKLKIMRGMEIDAALQNQGLDVDFGRDFILPIEENTLVRGTDYAFATLFTAHGAVPLSFQQPGGVSGNLIWYSLGSGALATDVVRLVAGSNSNAENRIERTIGAMPGAPQDLDTTRIAPFDGQAEPGSLVRLTGLDHRPSDDRLRVLGYRVELSQPGRPELHLTISSGWLGGETSFALELPSAVSGFDSEWAIAPGTETEFLISAIGSTGSLASTLYNAKQVGLEHHYASKSGEFITP